MEASPGAGAATWARGHRPWLPRRRARPPRLSARSIRAGARGQLPPCVPHPVGRRAVVISRVREKRGWSRIRGEGPRPRVDRPAAGSPKPREVARAIEGAASAEASRRSRSHRPPAPGGGIGRGRADRAGSRDRSATRSGATRRDAKSLEPRAGNAAIAPAMRVTIRPSIIGLEPPLVVREAGVEPASPFGHRILSPARLPVPPLAPVRPARVVYIAQRPRGRGQRPGGGRRQRAAGRKKVDIAPGTR